MEAEMRWPKNCGRLTDSGLLNMEGMKPTPEVLRQVVLESRQPIIFRNIINDEEQAKPWRSLNFESLRDLLGDMPLSFRTGKNARTKEPQWDLNCPVETMTMNKFLEESQKSHEDWHYFDYKYMHEWFKNKPEFLSAVDWRAFGFDKTGEDSTLWIGNRGAHTNCHQDSYGCNLVAQIHGRKQWLLFPADSGKHLRETRVPYEESTVYSKINFFSPSKSEEELLERIDRTPILTILEPGDVLFVPKGWWHFVESLDVTISINVWLPLASDSQARLKEVLVKLIMKKVGEGLPAVRDEVPYDLGELLQLAETCIKDCKSLQNESSGEPIPKRIKQTPRASLEEYGNYVKKLNPLSKEEFKTFLRQQRERFPDEEAHDLSSECYSDNTLQNITDAFCHSDIVNQIAEMLLNNN